MTSIVYNVIRSPELSDAWSFFGTISHRAVFFLKGHLSPKEVQEIVEGKDRAIYMVIDAEIDGDGVRHPRAVRVIEGFSTLGDLDGTIHYLQSDEPVTLLTPSFGFKMRQQWDLP